RPDPLDLAEERRALVDDAQRSLAKGFHDPSGEVRADPLDQPGAQIALDALDGVRRRGAELVRLELQTVVPVLRPVVGRLDVLAGDRAGEVADDRDQPP